MGFLGLAPADALAATYAPADQILTLYAKGTAPNYTYGYNFARLPWLGGLKYELLAWSGPHAAGTTPYTHTQRFDVPNLSIVDPDGEIQVLTAEGDRSVTVRWLGVEPTNAAADDPFAKSVVKKTAGAGTPSRTLDAEAVTLTVLLGEPFTITESLPSTRDGSVRETHSPNALLLQTAGVDLGALTWTFLPLETSRTQVVLTRRPSAADPAAAAAVRRVYNVDVIVLGNALIAGDDLTGPPAGPLRSILDFQGRVLVAERIVRRAAPEAALLEAKATLPRGVVYPVTDPLRLSQLACAFATDQGTAFIFSTGWGEFSPPVFTSCKRIGARTIDVMALKLDIVPAVESMRKAGYTEAFWNADLAFPLVGPGEEADEPRYMFKMVDRSYVFVGAMDGRVERNEAGEKALRNYEAEAPAS